ncbi:MAG: Mpo1-like protein [Acidobacteriota bacterium]
MSLSDAETFEEFWWHYDALHGSPRTRKAHAVATLSAITLLGLGVYRRSLALVVAAPIVDFAIAQLSHRAEGVTTEPWRHPLWHLRAELRLLRRTLRSRKPGQA